MMKLGAAVAVSSVFALSCAAAPPPRSQPSPLLERAMPSFEGLTLGQSEFFSAKGQGHPMVVKFFSADCDRCKETVAAVQRILSDDSGIIAVGISEDDSESTLRFVNDLEVRFPVILDHDKTLARAYHVDRMPMTFVISPNGNVRWVGGPEQTEDALRAAVSLAED